MCNTRKSPNSIITHPNTRLRVGSFFLFSFIISQWPKKWKNKKKKTKKKNCSLRPKIPTINMRLIQRLAVISFHFSMFMTFHVLNKRHKFMETGLETVSKDLWGEEKEAAGKTDDPGVSGCQVSPKKEVQLLRRDCHRYQHLRWLYTQSSFEWTIKVFGWM